MTTLTVPEWRKFPRASFGAWVKGLLGLKVPKERITLVYPSNREKPTDAILRASNRGFRRCTDQMVDDTLKTTSKHVGIIIFPLDGGRRRLLEVRADRSIIEVPESRLKFATEHRGRWRVAMVRPERPMPSLN